MYFNYQTGEAEHRSDDWRQTYVKPYFRMFEETPFISRRIILPRNIFEIVDMKNNNETAPIYIIEEDVAFVNTSRIMINYTVGDTFRSDQRIIFNASVHDKYFNVRNQSNYT